MRKMIIQTQVKADFDKYYQIAVKPDGSPVPFYDIKNGEYYQQLDEGDLVISNRRGSRGLLHPSNANGINVSIVFNNQLTRIHPNRWLMNKLLANETVDLVLRGGGVNGSLGNVEDTLIWRQVTATAHALIPNIAFWEVDIENSFYPREAWSTEGYYEFGQKVKRLVHWVYHKDGSFPTPSKLIENISQVELVKKLKETRGSAFAFIHLSNKGILLSEYPDRPMSLHYLPLDISMSDFGDIAVIKRKDS
jgi:hypothetical protein